MLEANSTLKDIKIQIQHQLMSFGIHSAEARIESQMIVEHATGWKLKEQLLHVGEPVDLAAINIINKIINERQLRKPIQYCLQEAWFMGLPFAIEPGVLIPRSDTEILVAAAIALLRPLTPCRFLEVGVGSGCITISILKALPHARAVAHDINPQAIALTRINADRHEVADRIDTICGDWVDTVSGTYNGIISNPPYIKLADMDTLAPEVQRWEPPEALYGTGADGLSFYRNLVDVSVQHLVNNGFMAVEVGDGQAPAIENIFVSRGWRNITPVLDLTGMPRVITAVSP